MISRRILFRHPNAAARTRFPPAFSPLSHLVNREIGAALSSTRTVNYYASAAAAPAAAPAVPLHSASAISQPSISSTNVTGSQQHPDFVQEAIQRLFKDAPAFSAPAASNASPSAPASASPSSSRPDPSPQVSEKVLELSIKTFQSNLENARLCLKDCAASTCPEELASEIDAADSALERAVNAYIDVLDGLREANPDQQAAHEAPRTAGHGQLKELRRQLDELKHSRVLSSAASESD